MSDAAKTRVRYNSNKTAITVETLIRITWSTATRPKPRWLLEHCHEQQKVAGTEKKSKTQIEAVFKYHTMCVGGGGGGVINVIKAI